MQILINGEKKEISAGTTLQLLMEEQKLSGGRAVAELNEEIVDRQDWEKTFFSENDVLEIVTFMGGGRK